MWFASNGYVCLIIDTLQLGEIAGIHHGTYREGRWWWHSRGYTPAGVECWNGIRGIDYLCSRPDVDPEKIGVTGISGGGATTVWVAAADDRVKVAVPVSGMSDLESYVTNKVVNGHCDCMFLVQHLPLGVDDDPGPVRPEAAAVRQHGQRPHLPDGRQPPHHRPAAEVLQDARQAGQRGRVRQRRAATTTGPTCGSRSSGSSTSTSRATAGEVKDADFPKIDGKELRVFPEDKDLPKDAINAKADEMFVPKAEVKLPEKPEDFKAWKAGLVKQLREKSFRALPEKVSRRERCRHVR